MKFPIILSAIFLAGTGVSLGPTAMRPGPSNQDCTAQGILSELGASPCVVLTCMEVPPSGPTLLPDDPSGKPGCHYQVVYSYELLECADVPLVLASPSVWGPLAEPGGKDLVGGGTKGFFRYFDGDPQKQETYSKATFSLGDHALLTWAVSPQ